MSPQELLIRMRALREIAHDVKHQQEKVEALIYATPSGPQRNVLTEANIMLLQAIIHLTDTSILTHKEEAK